MCCVHLQSAGKITSSASLSVAIQGRAPENRWEAPSPGLKPETGLWDQHLQAPGNVYTMNINFHNIAKNDPSYDSNWSAISQVFPGFPGLFQQSLNKVTSIQEG